ncbi:universal stress protein [Flavobacterium psychrotolerans]|uniref:Universal stress protein UspA n=1 Tax=Flavobacterium psychrotolerans TaxID=2169410 RepID=A0A2U1JM54_9FLAO|nr:universal stress protein [Flavobacterium psychrotolerans]PWA06251.1 universal stress protein UspA [Flavobacterium psychrotolerans]
MEKILFPTDFSETANNAFVYVLEMAKVFKAEVIVLHVYELPPVSYEGYPIYVSEVFESVELDKFENFKDQIPYLRKIAEEHHFDTLKMSHVLEQGDLVSVVKAIAKKNKVDFIIMGTNGASGLKETFMGSNTGSVIADVPITLLSVPFQAKFKQIKKIAFTTRYRAKDHKALQQVVEFANKVNAQVKCLHVRTADSDVKEVQIDKWRHDFKNDPVEFFVIPDNDIEGTIFEFLDDLDIDILAMLTYKRSFLQELFRHSFTKKFSYHSEIPLLVFHE